MAWLVRLIPPPDRSKYRHPPYWYPDTPLPLFAEDEPAADRIAVDATRTDQEGSA